MPTRNSRRSFSSGVLCARASPAAAERVKQSNTESATRDTATPLWRKQRPLPAPPCFYKYCTRVSRCRKNRCTPHNRARRGLDARQHIIDNQLNLARAEKIIRLQNLLRRRIVFSIPVTFLIRIIIGIAQMIRHSGARPAAFHGQNDLVLSQRGPPQGERIASVAAAAVAVPFVTSGAIGAIEALSLF